MQRQDTIDAIQQRGDDPYDFLVIGGGSTGLGVAMDAISRGYSVLLVEQSDFAKGTSSRSTKLAHGGVRYLAQGDLALVLEALKERGLMLRNAPHLVSNQSFIIPIYSTRDRFKYTAGLKLYDLMAGRLSFGKSTFIDRDETLRRLPTIAGEGLKGGVVYQDGQFDDARLALQIAMSCIDAGAHMLNYAKVESLVKSDHGRVEGLTFSDIETGNLFHVKGRAVINATGVFSDDILRMDNPNAPKSIVPSQGIHLVISRAFSPGEDALMIPETSDGRVLFAVPWYDKLVLGTTDTLRPEPTMEPKPLEKEIEFILETASEYLLKPPTRSDVLSIYAGLRPLAAPQANGGSTKEISRSHKIIISDSKLITITGGKWTTYRKMGEDTVSKAIDVAALMPRKSQSADMRIRGFTEHVDQTSHLGVYGSDQSALQALIDSDPRWQERLHKDYPYQVGQVIWAIRHEMARKIEDVLSRRIRILFLDAEAALEMAPKVAEVMAEELKRDKNWVTSELKSFNQISQNYLIDIPQI